jgi:hypothetical protein
MLSCCPATVKWPLWRPAWAATVSEQWQRRLYILTQGCCASCGGYLAQATEAAAHTQSSSLCYSVSHHYCVQTRSHLPPATAQNKVVTDALLIESHHQRDFRMASSGDAGSAGGMMRR